MATAMNMEEFVNCDICFEPYDKPQILPCLHTYCLKCVDQIKHQHYTECPVCKKRCRTEDIKLDFRTAALVESYQKQNEKDNRVITCESCEWSFNVSHKCETCDLMLCQRCEASHTVTADLHFVRTIPSVAAEIREEIEQVANHLQQQEQVLSTRLANRQTKLEGVRKTCDDALVKINEHEENLIRKMKCHHDGLRKQVDKEKKKCIEKSKRHCKEVEIDYQNAKDKQTMFNSWLNTRSDLSLANTAQVVRDKLHQAMTEANVEREMEFKVDVIGGQDYDEIQSTKVVIRDADGDRGEEVMGLTATDFTSATCRDYKAEKTVNLPETVYTAITQGYNSNLYIMAGEKLYIYTKDLALVKTITHDCTPRGNFIYIQDKYFIIANEHGENTGLTVLDAEGKHLQVICPGHFLGVHLFGHKIYAFEENIKRVLIFEQTPDHFWKQTGYIHLNGYNDYKDDRPNYNGLITYQSFTNRSFGMNNEHIYLTDSTTLYHWNYDGILIREIKKGVYGARLHNHRISGVDSRGNVLLYQQKHIVLVDIESKSCAIRLRGHDTINTTQLLFTAGQKECIAVAPDSSQGSYLIKYKADNVQVKVI